MRYENFDLFLTSSKSGGYSASVTYCPSREIPGATFDAAPSLQGSPKEAGAALYGAAFGGEVDACFRRNLTDAQRAGTGLRVRIRIHKDAWELSELPWELLYLRGLDRFLAQSPETPVVRDLEVSGRPKPLAVRPPITVLAVVAAPTGWDRVAVEEEWTQLQEALSPLAGIVSLELLPHATRDKLRARLAAGPVHVLHFVGHGVFDDSEKGAEKGLLVLETAEGGEDYVSGAQLKDLLLGKVELTLAFLGACEGGRGGGGNAYGGVAHQLALGGVPAVVAMQRPVAMAANRKLSAEFYRRVAQAAPVDAALSDARRALAGEEDAAWATPVLFSRSGDLQLLDLPPALAEFKRKPFEPETVVVPAGPFLMGSNPGDGIPDIQTPQHEVHLEIYRIGKYPVTCEQYGEFLFAVGKVDNIPFEKPPPGETRIWFNKRPTRKKDHPVTGVGWWDAVKYCEWLSKATGRTYRLPTEAEWEKAARGKDGRRYPWGDDWAEGATQFDAQDTAPVTAHPGGRSPYGCEDMLGNAEEWTNTIWESRKDAGRFVYEYDATDGREERGAEPPALQQPRVYRGGHYGNASRTTECATRKGTDPKSRPQWRGFRVVMDP